MDFKIFVISHKRADNVKRMQEFIDMPFTWIVGNGEGEDYRSAGADLVVEGGSLIDSRNLALELAEKQGAVCIQVSDDLRKIEHLSFPSKKKVPILFKAVVETFMKEIWRTPFYLYGIPPTPNAFYVHQDRSLNNFIIGDFMVIKPNELRFDPEFKLKEDYDYTCQHIKKYGGVMRFDDFLFTFSHYKNSGGAVSFRTDELEKEVVEKLLAKHPEFIRRNPKRANEVLLKVRVPKKAS